MTDFANGLLVGGIGGVILGFFAGFLYYVFALARRQKKELIELTRNHERRLDELFQETRKELLAAMREINLSKTLPDE